MESKGKIVLVAIVSLALLLRVLFLDQSPPSLNWDEVSFGYNAYSIYKTGRDEFGSKYPILLRSFDDYKPALYAYLTVPFVSLFGLNEYSTRIVSVLSGTLSVLAIYFLAFRFTKDRLVSYFSALSMAFAPWAILFSRVAFEANLSLALLLWGTYFAVSSRFENNRLLIGVFLISLSMHAYTASKILAPVVGLALLLAHKKTASKNKKLLVQSTGIALTFILPLVYTHIAHPYTLERLNATSLKLTPLNFISEVVAHYISYFSPANIFVRGTPEPSQGIPGFGMFHAVEFIYWAVGLGFIVKHTRKYRKFVVLLAVSPIAGAVTWNWFYPARVLFLLSLFSIAIGIGAAKLARGKKVIFASTLMVLLISLVQLVVSIFYIFPVTQRGVWQYGMKEIVANIAKTEYKYDKVIIETNTAQPHIFLLYYLLYPPTKYQEEIKDLASDPRPRKNFDFGKFEFRPVYWPEHDEHLRKTLLVSPPSSLPLEKAKASPNFSEVLVVTDGDGNVLAHIVGLQ